MTSIKEGNVLDCVSGQEVKATPEEIQAVQPFAMKLMEDYGYPKSHIQTRPQWHVKVRPSDVKKEYPVDIAVFTSENHDDNSLFMIVECKKKTRKDGRTQLEDYMRLSKAVLGVWFNGDETLYLRKYEENGSVVHILTIDALTKAISPCAIGKLVDSLGVKLMFMRNVLGLDFIPG